MHVEKSVNKPYHKEIRVKCRSSMEITSVPALSVTYDCVHTVSIIAKQVCFS